MRKIKLYRTIRRKVKRSLSRMLLHILGSVETKHEFEGALNSIVILAQEKIGDAILLTPLLKNLKKAFPEVEIHIVAFSPVFPFFEKDRNVSKVYRVKQNYLSYFKDIRTQKFDLLFSTKDHPSFTFLYQSRIISARNRVGIYHPGHDGFFNHYIHLDFHKHVIEKNCALLNYLGVDHSPEECQPYIPEDVVSRNILDFSKQIEKEKIIGLNLSAGELNREWSNARWAEFLKKFQQRVILFAMQNRISDKKNLEKRFSHVIPSPTTRNIYEAAQILRHLALLISPDTSLIHAASCYKIPVIGMYRSEIEHFNRFYPYQIPNRSLISKTRQIEDIPVEEVIKAVEEMLKFSLPAAEEAKTKT